MAYGLYLYKEIKSKSGKTIRLEIFQKDYSGSSIEIESMSGVPLTLVSDNANGGVYLPIVKSFLNINIIDTEQIDYSVFFTPDATKFKVLLKVNGTLEWSGYLTPDSFSQSLQYKSEINLVARDNLGMLSEFDFDLTNRFYSISTLINTALTRIGFQFTLETRTTKVDSANETIVNGLTQSKFWVGKNWQEVLETILTGIGCQLRYVGGNKYAIFDIGNLSSLGTTEVAQPFVFIEQSGIQEIVPAWKVITINQDYGKVDNSYDGFIEEASFEFYSNKGGDENNPYNFYTRPYYTISLSSDWGSTIPMLNPYEYPNLDPNDIYITGKSPATTLFMGQGLTYGKYFEAINDGKAIQFKFKASNYPYYITRRRSGEYMVEPMLRARYLYEMKVRCNLFAQTATEKYVLQGRNWIIWTAGYSDALEFTLPQTKESGVYGKQGTELTSQMDSPQEQDITIEAYGLGVNASVYIEFYPYTATYTEVDGLGNVDDYPAIVYDVHTMKLSSFEVKIVENEFGGLETKATLNADHNINGGIELALGQVPRGLGGYHTYLGGIFKNSNPYYPPMYDFHFTGGVNYTLSELVGREIAHHYKTQRKKLSGNIINSENFAAMPSFAKPFTDGTLTYALNYGSLDFRNEVMSVELIEVEDYTTEDYTFIDAEIDTGGGESLGSGETEFIQWSAAGNAKRIYELDTATEAEQGGAYVVIDKIGLAAAKKVALLDLLVDAYTKSESDAKYLGITAKAADSELLDNHDSTYFATATGGTGYIQNQISSAQTADYWISGKAKAGTLIVPQIAPTLSSGEAAIYALDSGFSGETPSGAGSVTSVALTMPTGFAVSGSPITESGTFGVTFASGYFLPTTTQFATKADVSLIGAANGITPLDSGGKVALQYLPSTLLKYMGVWNASINSPTLTSPDTNRKGQVWNVSVAGTQFGLDFKLGDWLIYNDSGVAEKSDNSDDVTSVNGYTGAVTLKTSDIAEQTNLYYTDARVKTYADTLYTPIAHGQITSGNPHGTTAADVGALALTGGTLSGILNLNSGIDLSWNGGWGANMPIITGNSGGLYLYPLGMSLSGNAYINNNGIWHAGNSNLTSINWSAAKLASTTLLLPQSAPTLASGEMAIYGLESGFSGETPSGAGSVTSISMVVPTGLSVTPATITESGTFTISYASGYQMMTSTESSKLAGIEANANNYSLPTATGSVLGGVKIGTNVSITDGVISVHNPVTLGTANGLSLSTQELSLGLASASANGALSSTDWSTFNSKAAGDHNHNGTYALISGATTQDFQVKALTMNGALSGATFGNFQDLIAGYNDTKIRFTAIGSGTSYLQSYLNSTKTAIPLTISGYSGENLPTINFKADSNIFSGAATFSSSVSAASFISGGNAVIHAGNYSSYALPLSGGTLSGILNLNSGIDLSWNGGWGAGMPIIVGNSSGIYMYPLGNTFSGSVHINGQAIYHTGNSNLTSVDWSAKSLTLAGGITGATSISLYNAKLGSDGSSFDINYNQGGALYFFGGTTTTKFSVSTSGAGTFASTVTMTENINTNLRIPKVAPTSPTSGQYYFYIVE